MADQDLQKAFGSVIRELRTSAGLSQEELAFAADRHFTYISMIERGRNAVTITTLWRLAAALGVEPSAVVERVQSQLATAD